MKNFNLFSHAYPENFDTENFPAQNNFNLTLLNEKYGIEFPQITDIIHLDKNSVEYESILSYKHSINFRGRNIPVVDVRTCNEIQRAKSSSKIPIVIVNIDQSDIGLVVGEQSELTFLDKNHYQNHYNNITNFSGSGFSFIPMD